MHTTTAPADAIQPTASSAIRLRIDALIPDLVALRRDLHRFPELAYEEERTSRIVADRLESLGLEVKRGLAGGTGVLANLPATADTVNPATVALRADMDALPITEQGGVEHASTRDGVMHACGHDGHTTILLGAAEALAGLASRPNHLTFLFQPAEESGGGGKRMCDDGALDGSVLGPRVERIFGLHGWPQLPVGTVATKPGAIMASTDEFELIIRGKQAHAAQPHLSRDPIAAAAQIITALQTAAARNADPLDAAVVTIGAFHAGTASNIIPEEARLLGTVRALRTDTRDMLIARVGEISSSVAAALGCVATFRPFEHYPVTRNDDAVAERFLTMVREAFGDQRVVRIDRPSMGAEDFAYYALQTPACFFWLGLQTPGGEAFPTLHSPTFDFNDHAIPTGVEAMCLAALDDNSA